MGARAGRRSNRPADVARVFAALGAAERLRIVAQLCAHGPQSTARLTERGDVTRQATTKHLRTLEEAGLVRGTRAGRERLWAMRAERVVAAQRYLDQISDQWDAAVERLKAFVEG